MLVCYEGMLPGLSMGPLLTPKCGKSRKSRTNIVTKLVIWNHFGWFIWLILDFFYFVFLTCFWCLEHMRHDGLKLNKLTNQPSGCLG